MRHRAVHFLDVRLARGRLTFTRLAPLALLLCPAVEAENSGWKGRPGSRPPGSAATAAPTARR